jgi:hypothetical protein
MHRFGITEQRRRVLPTFEDFKKIDSDEGALAFVRQYALTEKPTPPNTQILGSYIGSYEGANIKLTHRWYDPSGLFSIQPDIHKAKLEVAGHQPAEVGYQG